MTTLEESLYEYAVQQIEEAHITQEDLYYSSDESIEGYFCCDVASGASKVVLMSAHDDWVVKIPLYGTLIENDYDGEVEGAEEYSCNYCQFENEIYERALEEGLGFLFAEEHSLGEYNGIDLYYQQKADSVGSGASESTEAERKRVLDSEEFRASPISSVAFVADIVRLYGVSVLNQLTYFLEGNGLGDFHCGNIGYIDGRPVLIDYSGFND